MQDKTLVYLYGDSIMRATVIDENKRYHSLMAELLQKISEKFALVFKNRAHFGITVEKGRTLLEKDLQNGLACNYALIEFGGNDCSFAWEEVAAAPQEEHQPFTTPEKYEKLMTQMVTDIRKVGVTPVLMTLPPIDAERYLNFVSRGGEAKKNILAWLGDVQMIYRFHESYSRVIEKIALETQTILVDVRGCFLRRHDFGSLLGLDGAHLSAEGYRLLSEIFVRFIQQVRKEPKRLIYG